MLGPSKNLEKFNHARIPIAHISRQLFEHGGCSLAAAKCNGMRHFRAGGANVRHLSMQGLVADEIADIRYDPWRAGLDELIVVELSEIFLQNTELISDDAQQGFELIALLSVSNPVNSRKQFE